jgi:hypothetical protein
VLKHESHWHGGIFVIDAALIACHHPCVLPVGAGAAMAHG